MFVYTGTYTRENERGSLCAHGKGIYQFWVDSAEWEQKSCTETFNPAVLSWGTQRKNIYCVNTNTAYISAFVRSEKTGNLQFLNSKAVAGKKAKIISNVTSKHVLYAADDTGVVSVFHILEDGSLGEIIQNITLQGEKGPLEGKLQPGSRPHHLIVSPDERFLLIPDKGFDCVHSLAINEESGMLGQDRAVKLRAASCPRHVAFHPNGRWVYVNTEYSSTVVLCDFNNRTGDLALRQIVPTLPDTFTGLKNLTAEIAVHPNGETLYVSNRGHDSICVMRISSKNGMLRPIQWIESGGRKPRFFAIDPSGRQLWCGCQPEDKINVFHIMDDGTLSGPKKTLEVPTPVWILFDMDTLQKYKARGE